MNISSMWILVILTSFSLATPVFAAEGGQTSDGNKEVEKPSEGRSADAVAKELANPNNSLASLTFKNQFYQYAGSLPDADEQSNYVMLFQPVFPFRLGPTDDGGNANIFFRPAFPVINDQPIPRIKNGQFGYDEESGIGDIGFDFAYGVTEKTGVLWAAGMVGTLPTATNDKLSGDNWNLGPEALYAKITKTYVLGIFPSHQWKVGGSGDPFSKTQIQYFAKYLPGGGWNIGTQPINVYDWKASQWTVPLNLSASKTILLGDMPLKIELEYNYYVERVDEFSPRWMIGVNITPVVPNIIEKWIKAL